MALIQLAPPYPVFTDKNGDPLDNGYLYFGVVDLNPETNPIQVYYDSTFTQPVAQPIRTSNGYPMRNGAPALIYAVSQFSVTVRDKNSDLVIYSPVGYGVDPSSVAGVVVVQDHTGDGVTTIFGMGASPSSENATNAYIDGVYQNKSTYSISGTTIVFSEAPPLYSAIEIVSNQTAIIGGTDAGLVTYNEGDTGAVTRTVKAKLQESVSVKDFGAVGDGVTDDTAAIQAALDSNANGINLYFPSGTYNFTALTITYKSSTITGAGFSTILSHTGTSNAITATGSTWSGLVLENFRLNGTALSGHGIYMDDGIASGNMGNVSLRNLYINGFNGVGKAGFFGKEIYNMLFEQVQVHNCYDGIYFGVQSIGNRLTSCWIRGFTRYGFAIVGIPTDSCFGNNFNGGIIDEAIAGVDRIGIYFYENNTSTISDIHFEDLNKGIVISKGINNRIVNNQFAVHLITNSWETLALAGNTYVEGNRYLSGAITDSGNRTLLFNDSPYSDIGDGGASNSRVSFGVSSTVGREGFLCFDGGNGIDLLGRQVKNVSMLIPNGVQSLTAGLVGVITDSDAIAVSAAIATSMDGFNAASSKAGRKVTLYFADGNTTLRDGFFSSTASYLRLAGGSNWTPSAYSSIQLLCIADTTWLEVSRITI